MNRVLMRMAKDHPHFVEQLNSLGFMKQQFHGAKTQVAEMLDASVFTVDTTLAMMHDEKHSMSTRQVAMARDKLNWIQLEDDTIGRVIFSEPPEANNGRDPDTVTEESFADLGISPKVTLLPFIFKTPQEVKKEADASIENEEFFLPDESAEGFAFEGCAQPALEQLGKTMDRLHGDGNLLPLKRGIYDEEDERDNPLTQKYRAEVLIDAFKYDSVKEATRMTGRFMDAAKIPNHPRYSDDFSFSFGGDKADNCRMVAGLGGERGLAGMVENGLVVYLVEDEEVPLNVRGTMFEPFSRITTEVEIQVPRTNDEFETHSPAIMCRGGDASSIASQSNKSTAVDKWYGCDWCMVARADQGNHEKSEKAPRRTLVNTIGAHLPSNLFLSTLR